MSSLIANRSFVYAGTAEDIKRWLHDNGYVTEDIMGEYNQPVGFKISETGIKVGHHRPLNEHDTGMPTVHLLNGPHLVETDPESAKRGITLYQKLYSKFRRRKQKEASRDQT